MGLSNQQIMDTILKGNSRVYAQRIAEGQDPYVAVSTYEDGPNEFIKDIMTKIGMTAVRGGVFINPLSKFKKGDLKLGDTLEDIYVGLVKPHKFEEGEEFNAQLEFGQEKPDIDVCYHKVNRRDMYKVSISDERLKSAFMSENGLQALISEIIATPVRSNELDEFEYAKKLLVDNLENTVVVPLELAPESNGAKEMLKAIKKFSKRLPFANDTFNKLRTLQSVPLANQALILPVDVSTDIDMDFLASIYHLDKASIEAKITEVDELKNPAILGWLIDERALQIRNHVINNTTNYVASKMMTNIFFHVWQLYGFSLYGTSIAFADVKACKDIAKDPAGNEFEVVNGTKALPGSMVVVVPQEGRTVSKIEWKADEGVYKTLEKGETTFTMPADTKTKITIKVSYAA